MLVWNARTIFKTIALHAVPTLVSQGPLFYLKFLVHVYSFKSYAHCFAR